MPLQAVSEEFVRRKRPMTIGVAIDGSVISDRALSAAAAFYKPSSGDRLVILHVADTSKTYLPRHLQPKHLESAYKAKAFDLTRADAVWGCIEKRHGQSTCEALTALAAVFQVDLLVVGSFGRKGEKIDMLGSVSDYSLRESHSSVAVVRSTAPSLAPSSTGGGSATYVVAVDDSRASAVAFCTVIHMLANPGDRVVVATVSPATAASADALYERYRPLVEGAKLLGEGVVWPLSRSQTVADGLLEVARAKGASTLVVGISGYGSVKLGSVSEEVSMRAMCNTIVVKDAHAVADNIAAAGARTLASLIMPGSGGATQRQASGTGYILPAGAKAPFENIISSGKGLEMASGAEARRQAGSGTSIAPHRP